MRTKNAMLNFLTDVFPLILTSIIGIFKLKIFLNTLGEETLGLYQLFSQIMIYIAIVDGGLPNAVLYSLYKPNVENDNKKLYSILVAARKTFLIIGASIFFLAFVVSFFVSVFIKDSTFSSGYLQLAFLLFSVSNVISYFFVPDQVLLEVKEKKYIVNLATQIGQIVQGILEIVLLLLGFSFINVLFVHIIVKFISSFVIYLIAKNKYKNPYKKIKPDYCFLPQIKHLIFHKINGLIGSNIDILIISKLLGLASVSIYSVYNYISNMLNTILSKFATSITAIVGNYMEEDNKKTYDLFLEFSNMMFFMAIIVCVPLLFAFDNFINIWYEGQIQTSMIIALSFSLLLFVNIIIQPVCSFSNSAGLFKQTKKCALFDTIINLVLSIVFVKLFKIAGVVLATFISMMICQFIMKSKVVYDFIIKQDFKKYLLYNLKFIIILILDACLGFIIFKFITINNIFMFFIIFILYFIINALLILFIFKIVGAVNFLDRFKKLNFLRSR